MIGLDKYQGCFLGLAMGDAYGAVYEGGVIERLLWRLIGRTKDGKLRYTDDTRMSLDIAESFLANRCVNQAHLAATFAASYAWSRGYGPSAGWLLKKIKRGANWQDVNRAKFKEGSFGNGAAMRAPVVALMFAADLDALTENIEKTAEITHAHPLAIEGAKLVALVTFAALHDWSEDRVLAALPDWCESEAYQSKVVFCIASLRSEQDVSIQTIRSKLGNGMAATQSSVTAIYFALRYRQQSFEAMFSDIVRLGGDTDTIAAMAGAIWGAFHGSEALDKDKVQGIEGAAQIKELATRLHQMAAAKLD